MKLFEMTMEELLEYKQRLNDQIALNKTTIENIEQEILWRKE